MSIVVPVFNERPYIEEAVTSALGQSYERHEVIVVDDGSTDGTYGILKTFEDSIDLYRQDRKGAPAARNKGLRASKGRYVLFLDGDDRLGELCLQALVSCAAPKRLGVCQWSVIRHRGHQKQIEPAPHDLSPLPGDPLKAWLEGWYVPPCAVLWPTDLVARLGGWDEKLTVNQDGDLVMRALAAGVELEKATTGQAYYRRVDNDDSVSSRRDRSSLRSRARILKKLEATLEESGQLPNYQLPLARAFHRAARNHFSIDRKLSLECHACALSLAGDEAIHGSVLHKLLVRLLGFDRAHRLKMHLRRILGLKR